MLKGTETKETIVVFFDIFIFGSISIGGGGVPPGPPGYAYGYAPGDLSIKSFIKNDLIKFGINSFKSEQNHHLNFLTL